MHYDISNVIQSGVIEEDLRKSPTGTKTVSKIIYSQGRYIKAYCQGFLQKDFEGVERLCIRMSGFCENADIKILEEELDNSLLIGICKLIYIKEVLPL